MAPPPPPSPLPRLLFPFLPCPRPTRMLHHRLLMFVRTRRHRGSRPTRIRLRISGFTCVESEMAVTCHYVALRGVMYARREACKKQQAAAAAGMMVISWRKPSFTSWSRQEFFTTALGGRLARGSAGSGGLKMCRRFLTFATDCAERERSRQWRWINKTVCCQKSV